MPTPDEELDLLLRASEDPLPTAAVPPVPDFTKPAPVAPPSAADAELDSLLAGLDSEEAAPTAEKPEDRIGHGASMPVQLIEAQPAAAGDAYTRGLKSEVKPNTAVSKENNKPWYKVFGETANDAVAGLSHGATMHMDSLLNDATRRRTAEARERSPIAFGVTDTVGAAVPSLAMTGAGLVGEAGKGVANFLSRTGAAGLQGMIQGAGVGIGNAGPDATAEERALATTKSANLGGVASAGLSATGEKLVGLAGDAKKSANEYLTQIFMTPAQRAGYKAAKGPDALAKLGAQAEAAGMFKPRSWVDRLLPANARRVAENAEKVRATAGPAIGQFEDQYVQGSAAEVPVGDIASGLRRKAAEIGNMVDTDSPADARVMTQLADRIDQPATAPVTGEFTEFPELREAPPLRGAPPPLPPRPEPEQLTFVPDRTPGPPMNRPEPVQQSLPLQPESESEQLAMSLDPGPQTSLAFPATKLPAPKPQAQLSFADDMPLETPAPPEVSVAKKLQAAYAKLRNASGRDHIAISDLLAESRVPHAEAETWLTSEPRNWRRGEFTAATEAQKNAAVHLDDGPHLYVSLKDSLPASAPEPKTPLAPLDPALWKAPKPPPAPVAPEPEQLGFGPQQMSFADVPAKPAVKELWTPRSLTGQQTDLGMAAVQKTPLAAEATLTRDNMPLQEAIANKRNLADRIDWSKKRADQTTYGQEAARKYTWGELSDRITNALQEEVTRGKIPASAMAQYKKNMQDFSTAATVYDPALKMAERHGQVGLGLTDLLTASAVGGGPAGGLAALSSKATRGMAPAVAARFNKMLAGMAEFGAPVAAGASRVAPQLTAIEEAQQQAPEGTPKYEIVEAANRRLKSQIHGLEPLLKRTP